jgi:aminoglycoside phosphotransferase (APT) family kinase protein
MKDRGEIALIPLERLNYVEIVNLAKVGAGLSSAIYTFTLMLPKNGSKNKELKLVLKIYRRDERTLCQREAEMLRALFLKGFPVPRLYATEIRSTLGRPFIIMEMVEGKSVSECLRQLNDDMILKITKHLAETLALLHSLSYKDLNSLRKPSDEYDYAKSQASLAKNLKDNLKVKWNIDWIIEWIKSNAPSHPCYKYSIIHGDMNLNNFLVTKSDKIVVLDWEYPEIGDPLKDVALAYLNLIFVFGLRKLDKGVEIGNFFVRQYAKRLNLAIDALTLRFYIVVSALVEAICYKFNCKQVLKSSSLIQNFGLRFFPAALILSWYFWWRSKVLERLIEEEIKCYDRCRGVPWWS